MTLDSHIDPDRGVITTRVKGRTSAAEVLAHQEVLADDPAFDPDFHHLFDLTEAETLEISSEQIRSLASVSIFSPSSRRAVVAPRDLLYGLSRMYEGFRDLAQDRLQIFRSRPEALAWLESEPESDETSEERARPEDD